MREEVILLHTKYGTGKTPMGSQTLQNFFKFEIVIMMSLKGEEKAHHSERRNIPAQVP